MRENGGHMKELLLRRKAKFIQYLIATFLFILEHFVQMSLFALILGAIEKADVQYYKIIVYVTIGYILYSPFNFLISRLLRIRYMRDTILDVRKQAFDKIYDDFEGSITVDKTDYREISEKSFHEKVAFIYQEVFLFEDTIKNNITLYKDIPADQIDNAVKVCGLDSIILEKKDGIEERLTENGKNLSGGQRQRISIARAIAKNAEILFVDEGTSSLNEELGREIEKVFLELENTVISISHRFYEGITENYDFVIEVKNGSVHSFPAKDYFNEVITC